MAALEPCSQSSNGRARVIATGVSATTGLAVASKPFSRIYSFPQGQTAAPPAAGTVPQLSLHVPQGSTNGVKVYHGATVYATIDAPQGTVTLGTSSNLINVVGAIIANYLNILDGAIVTGQIGFPPGLPGTVDRVRVLGWRPCQNTSGANICAP